MSQIPNRINLDQFESDLDLMKKKLEKPRKPRPPPSNLNLGGTPRGSPTSTPSTMSSMSLPGSRAKPGSLDFSTRRSDVGFASRVSMEPANVPLVGIGTVELDGFQHRGVTEKDFTSHGPSWLGSGTSGTVFKMNFLKKRDVAVKQISKSDDPDEMKRLRMDLGVMMKSRTCPYIVRYLGAVQSDASVWIVMELMLGCFEKILKNLRLPIPVPVLGSLTVSVVSALNYLKENHSTIHRDVKPSNILVDSNGRIKLCDFGISGRLVDSQARTRGAGCAAYLSPERIDPERGTYDVRADIWSLGLSLIELATAQFPYSGCKSDFEVCAKILQAEAPQLGLNFPQNFRDFVSSCCIKDVEKRPKYAELMRSNFFRENHSRTDRDIVTQNWLRSSNQIPNTVSLTAVTSSAPSFGATPSSAPPKNPFVPFENRFGAAVHTPQPITNAQNSRNVSNGFSPIVTDWQVRGRENWASFGVQSSSVAPPVAINSVPVQIENQTNPNSDLISF